MRNDNAMERRDILLYLLSKIDSVDSNARFHSVIYRLKNDFGIFDDYVFDADFLYRSDQILEKDLDALFIDHFTDRHPVMMGLVTEKATEISDHGRGHLYFFEVRETLGKKFGKNLKDIEKAFVSYNSMPIRELLYKNMLDASESIETKKAY